jgi:hypothetical protein
MKLIMTMHYLTVHDPPVKVATIATIVTATAKLIDITIDMNIPNRKAYGRTVKMIIN